MTSIPERKLSSISLKITHCLSENVLDFFFIFPTHLSTPTSKRLSQNIRRQSTYSMNKVFFFSHTLSLLINSIRMIIIRDSPIDDVEIWFQVRKIIRRMLSSVMKFVFVPELMAQRLLLLNFLNASICSYLTLSVPLKLFMGATLNQAK